MKTLYTADLHGSLQLYRELEEIVISEKVGLVLIGGDLLPRFGHDNLSLINQKIFIEEKIYPFLLTMKKCATEVGIIPGNNDWQESINTMKELARENLIHLLHLSPLEINTKLIIRGYPYIPPTPFAPKDFEKCDMRKDSIDSTNPSAVISSGNRIVKIEEKSFFAKRGSIEEDLDRMAESDMEERSIYIFHAPPHDSLLDRLHNGSGAGSRAVKEFIKKNRPYITLHGHVHESPEVTGRWWQFFGTTLSINPGQWGKMISAVIFETDSLYETMYHTKYGKLNDPIIKE